MAATSGNILDTIGALYDSLTKTEKRIATTVLSSPELLGQNSLAEIAQQFDVGEATFIRFCRTLGFKGFTDFKLQLSIELATKDRQSNSLLETDISKFDGTSQIAEKLQNVIHNVISETVNLLDFAQLEKVVELMRVSKRIFLFGVGSSGLTAEEAKNKLMRIGLHVDATSNNHFMYMQAALMNSSDIVIGISHSGYSKETVQALNIAKKNGAVTVALTHNLRSPITMVSDYVLINGNRQGQLQGDSIGTKIAQLFVLDLIYTLIVQAEEESAVQTKQKTVNVILEQRIK
ncbi:MurR/RpiR family transcriptional regulator [Histophilus somni]|uniref:MurR/RpiR family transcriptional regulator n=2 Tax=Histophilus somni TaxID=731 RepID=A0AAX2S0I4_HISSO|nr:MurR/RpiR family transcriptional regulator [Histophilus somni]ACA30826.1 transcriptional regulator, RpiR family [Histophilus somni 2336]QEH08657.1 MurR/RpiR family transcriptional regulator [Histophilus somni]QEH12762.1 MurR/RpiR family transcriptional regulator [Histophilus somni]QEH24926.1 MurR/RpiR family transcriptional regulator [Histophilus somni]QEH27938.1 MurR/RpiR family transcriptional regulator [Histophilus somni]